MELYLSAKVLFDKVDGSVSCPDKTLRPNDHEVGNLTIHRHGCGYMEIVNGANKSISEGRTPLMMS